MTYLSWQHANCGAKMEASVILQWIGIRSGRFRGFMVPCGPRPPWQVLNIPVDGREMACQEVDLVTELVG